MGMLANAYQEDSHQQCQLRIDVVVSYHEVRICIALKVNNCKPCTLGVGLYYLTTEAVIRSFEKHHYIWLA